MRQTYLGEIYQSILNSHTGDTYAYSKMSTQHIGDGPPGDEDFYDPEEENIRPSGSSFNPKAAAWDPEMMELHRIVHWLLALEERRTPPTRPV